MREIIRQVLVTGADGFIGSHLTEALVARGYKVKALSYYNSFNSWGWLDSIPHKTINEIEVLTGDVRDPFFVKAAMQGCQAVLHLASLIAIPYSYSAPGSYIDTNVTGTLNVLQAARELGVDSFIHTSTSEVYGTAQYVPIDEKHPLVGQSPYSASKIAADQLAYSYFASFDLPVTIVRPFNTFGPRQSARAVIPTIISQIASGASSLSLGALHPTRDFSFVDDTVSGFIAALETDGCSGETINLGTGFDISIGDTVNLIKDILSSDIEVVTSNERLRPESSEVERLLSDNSKAKELLNWTPDYAGKEGLKQALITTVNWFTEPANLRQYKSDIYNV